MPPKKKASPQKIEPNLRNTKQELLEAYEALQEELAEKTDSELQPEKKLEALRQNEIQTHIQGLTLEGVKKALHDLRLESAVLLNQLSDKFEGEVLKLSRLEQGISLKEKELHEIYGIEKNAATFAALLEAQRREKENFLSDMEEQRDSLEGEMESAQAKWASEKGEYEAALKERTAQENRKREREKEEFLYNFEREKKLVRDKFEDEKAKLTLEKLKMEEELKTTREKAEKAFEAREKTLAEGEKEFSELKQRAQAYPKELETAVNLAIKEVTEKLTRENGYIENLLKQKFEGEKKVFSTQIESLEKTVKEQAVRLEKLAQLQEGAYQKVQDVAVKAIEGASKFGAFTGLQNILGEQKKGSGTDK